ncbi:binding-protein-dependent transport systems inner membrane component [Roseibium sp. TrichSKD4]|uniref:ABC transporter permease n=1 Tax=Roseibium sp. TrichSKD4 TaxID=744980 RepID=UPI0001E57191|nr:ABC transporter permease subunit [Roseibium sp. TrichSKD4]EFO28725.1 binding-protein-dependent transport systems inner membrane component [Roseibium sp. TrichSKD4]
MDWRKSAQVVLLLLPGLGLILAMIGSVLYIAVAQSFGYYNLTGESGFSVEFWESMLDRKIYNRSWRYSLYIGFFSAIISVALAYPLAIWLRRPFAGSDVIGALLKAPLLVHGLVAAFLFINVVSYNGIFNQFMQGIGLWDGPRRLQNDQNGFGVLILQVWKQMPFALLIMIGSVQAISDDVLDAARDLGAGAFTRFRRIIAPLSLSAMQAALVIIFMGAVADFSFQVIAGPTNRQSLAQLMVFFKENGQWNDAAVVGVTLMVLALLCAGLLALTARIIVYGRIR